MNGIHDVLKAHLDSKADVTIVYTGSTNAKEDFLGCDTLTMDKDRRITEIGKNRGSYKSRNISMSIVAARLAELQPAPVHFVNATRGEELENAVKALKDGEIVLMQNTRYEKGETKNDPELSKYWASLGDAFVEDAFGSVHRAHASTVGIPSNLKEVAGGFLIEKELKYLGQALDDPKRPFVAVLGGAKVSDKIAVIDNLLKIADKVIVGGGMGTGYRSVRRIHRRARGC